MAVSPSDLPRHLEYVVPHWFTIHASYSLPHSNMSLNVFSFIDWVRSALISADNNLNSLAVHVVPRRHESSFVPNVVSVSDVHFVKFFPHLSVIHERRAESQVLTRDALVVGATFDAASSAARWARTIAARLDAAASVFDDDATSNTVSNWADLFSTGPYSTGVVSFWVAYSYIYIGVAADVFLVAVGVVAVVFVDDAVVFDDTGVFLLMFADIVGTRDAVVRDTTAASAPSVINAPSIMLKITFRFVISILMPHTRCRKIYINLLPWIIRR